jgi:hypothetical protein
MAVVQPRNVRDATETARRVFFNCATFLVRFGGSKLRRRFAEHHLSPE